MGDSPTHLTLGSGQTHQRARRLRSCSLSASDLPFHTLLCGAGARTLKTLCSTSTRWVPQGQGPTLESIPSLWTHPPK